MVPTTTGRSTSIPVRFKLKPILSNAFTDFIRAWRTMQPGVAKADISPHSPEAPEYAQFTSDIARALGPMLYMGVGEIDADLTEHNLLTNDRLSKFLFELGVSEECVRLSYHTLTHTVHTVKRWPGYCMLISSEPDHRYSTPGRSVRRYRLFVFKMKPLLAVTS